MCGVKSSKHASRKAKIKMRRETPSNNLGEKNRIKKSREKRTKKRITKEKKEKRNKKKMDMNAKQKKTMKNRLKELRCSV